MQKKKKKQEPSGFHYSILVQIIDCNSLRPYQLKLTHNFQFAKEKKKSRTEKKRTHLCFVNELSFRVTDV